MFKLTFVTQDKKVIAGAEIEEVTVPAHKGELNILPGHAPLLTILNPGVLKYKLKGASKLSVASISWGYCEVSPEGVNVLAETIETPEEIDLERAKASQAGAEKALSQQVLEEEAWQEMHGKMLKAQARIEASKHK